MREVLMSAGTIATIVLFLVGLVKLPFKSFKEKHPHWYKATFYLLSLVLSVALPILSQKYILGGSLTSLDFLIHILMTTAIVFGGYAGYEGVGLKKMCNIAVANIKTSMATYSDTRIAKMLKSVGLDKIIAVDKSEKEKAILEAQKKVEEAKKKEEEAKKKLENK